MTHIGFNLIRVVPDATGGLETYARELVRALRAAAPAVRFTAFVCREGAADGARWLDADVEICSLPVTPGGRFGWIPGEQTLLPRLAARQGCHLVHSLASTGPARGPFRRVTTIHDLIYRVLPAEHRGLRFLGARWLVARGLVPLAARCSHRVITHSRAVQSDLRRYLGLPTERIDVFPLGPGSLPRTPAVSEAELRARHGLGPGPFVLSVSTGWPHKNLAGLIDALALLCPAERPLVVVPGRTTRYEPQLQRRALDRKVASEYRPLGWVSAGELEALYAAAACVVLPSLYEGFGLPVLEAMRRGVPVVCSNTGALVEVAGDAALLFDPRSPAEIAETLRRVVHDPDEAHRLRLAARRRASLFTWEETARQTLVSYSRALGVASLGTDPADSTESRDRGTWAP